MIAFGAVERAKFESDRPRQDARKRHAGSALRAVEVLNCEQWDCGWVIGHCIPLGSAGAQNSQSPVEAEEASDGIIGFSILPGVDLRNINSASPRERFSDRQRGAASTGKIAAYWVGQQ
jgi:hypothetical protein